jgi:pimeloyl-ACP methyl ester carboxylesterase
VLPNLKGRLILEGAGHWVQQERPEEVNAALIDVQKKNALQPRAGSSTC